MIIVLLAGCAAPPGLSLPPATDPGSPALPGAKFQFRGNTYDILHTVVLPGGLSTEPSIAVGSNGIAVAGPARGGGTASLLTKGGYVWASQDGGDSFSLVLDPKDGTPQFCSCDTDVVASGSTLYATTMYWTVRPVFNANLVRSSDGGATWSMVSPMASRDQPIDRPWLAADSEGTVYFTYRDTRGVPGASPTYLDMIKAQRSEDGGRTWSDAVAAATGVGGPMVRASKPVSPMPGTLLIPYTHATPESKYSSVDFRIARSDDAGSSFTSTSLAHYTTYAYADFSVSAVGSGQAVAVWSAADDDTRTHGIYVRVSSDAGLSWAEPQRLPLPGSAMQPYAAMREDGAIAIAYYGTDSEGGLFQMEKDTPWEPRVALLSPSGELSLVAKLSDGPVYRGWFCNSSGACPEEQLRTPLREFLSAAWSEDGTLFVAFTDATDVPAEEMRGRIAVARIRPAP